MNTVSVIWLQFALCVPLIGYAGYQLSRYGDAIAQRTGLSGSWVGLGVLAMYLLNTYILYLYGE